MANPSSKGVKTSEFFMNLLAKGGPLTAFFTIEATDPWFVVLGKTALGLAPEIGSWLYTKSRTDLKKSITKLDLP